MRERNETGWVHEEVAGCEFGDRRLGKRFEKLLTAMAGQLGSSLSVACQDWTNTKGAYRFLANARINERAILAGHFQATRERAAATEGPLLVLHDTTEFSFTRQEKTAIGLLRRLPLQRAFGGNGRNAAEAFLRKAIRTQGLPEKITIDQSGANTAAIMHYNKTHRTAIIIRHSQYLNNIVEMVFTQMTKPDLLAARMSRQYVADFHFSVGDEYTVNK